MFKRKIIAFAIIALFLMHMLAGGVSASYIYPFEIFTDNDLWGVNGDNFSDPNLNLYVEVYNGAGTASFKFHNQSNSTFLPGVSITDVYFDDGTLLDINSIENGAGVSFTPIATPGELPGANLLVPPFVTTGQFSSDSNPPPPKNGVEPGEWVTIKFDLMGGGTLADVIDELNDGTLRVGIHIQSFPDKSSESAVNVPEPATVALLGIGALFMLKRKRR